MKEQELNYHIMKDRVQNYFVNLCGVVNNQLYKILLMIQ